MATHPIISFISSKPSLLGILLGNLVPVLGVLLLGWDAFDVVFVYWLENAVIGVITIFKIAIAGSTGQPGQHAAKAVIPFFCVHYGLFMTVHLVFIVVLLGTKQFPPDLNWSPIERIKEAFSLSMLVALVALVIEHGYAFYRNYWQSGEYRKTHAVIEMFRPYGRIVVLHIAILFGAFLLMALQFPPVMAVLLVLLKTGLELGGVGGGWMKGFTESRESAR